MPRKPSPRNDAFEKPDRIVSKDYVLILIASLGGTFMNQFFHAVTPLYIEKLGGLQLHAGMMTSAFALAALTMRPVAGVLSDKSGRVVLMTTGLLICALSCAMFGVVRTIPLLLISRMIIGAGFGTYSTCSGAAVADVLPKSRMAEGLGYYGLYTTVSLSVAPAIALHVISGNTLNDFRTLFFLTAALCLFCAIVSIFITYERKNKKQALNADGLSALNANSFSDTLTSNSVGHLPRTIFGFETAVFVPMAAIVLVYGGNTGLLAFITPFARWKGIENPSLYYTFNAIGVFVSRILSGKVADRRGADIVIVPAIVLLGVCLVLLPYVDTLALLVLIALPLGLSMGAILTTFNAMIFNRCSPARRGTASGAYFFAIDFGWAFATPLLGALADLRDYSFMYRSSAVLVFLGLIFYLLVCSDRKYNARQLL